MKIYYSFAVFTLFIFATCKQNQNRLPEIQYYDWYDYSSGITEDSLKYLLPILDSVLKKDQYYRKFLSSQESKSQDYSLDLVNEKMRDWDSENLAVVENIISKHGYLGNRDLGMKGGLAMFMVLQHADLKTQEKYLPLLEKALERGNVLPSQFGMYVDRINMGNRKPQKFGTQLLQSNKDKFELYPLLNADSVDHWRINIGMLENMKQYLGRFNTKWDVGEYKKLHNHLVKKYKVVEDKSLD